MRTIIIPADLGGAALAALKQWLAISTDRDDAALASLLRASLDICEAFTGAMPLAATCEEIIVPDRDWQCLATRPVQAIIGIDGVPPDGARAALPIDAYELELGADGMGWVRITRQIEPDRFAVRFIAGLALDWAALPDALQHGIIRLAAQQFRERDSATSSVPPASVTALWQPWRRLRVA